MLINMTGPVRPRAGSAMPRYSTCLVLCIGNTYLYYWRGQSSQSTVNIEIDRQILMNSPDNRFFFSLRLGIVVVFLLSFRGRFYRLYVDATASLPRTKVSHVRQKDTLKTRQHHPRIDWTSHVQNVQVVNSCICSNASRNSTD